MIIDHKPYFRGVQLGDEDLVAKSRRVFQLVRTNRSTANGLTSEPVFRVLEAPVIVEYTTANVE